MSTTQRTLNLTRFSILLALEAVFCFTPLGSIPMGPSVVATIAALPVIVTGILMGPKFGSLMGAFTGLFSFLVMSFVSPNPASFLFTPLYSLGDVSGNAGSLVICFLPRILIGTVSGGVYLLLKDRFAGNRQFLALTISSALGSLTNTFGVVGLSYLFFGSTQSAVLAVVFGMVAINGVMEALVNGIFAPVISRALQAVARRAQV